jgi:hypothetical protein
MSALILTGSKREIAQQVANLEGQVREAVVFIEETSNGPPPVGASSEELFAEMERFTVQVADADYSREAAYSRAPGE